jgi:hypothetical protein
VSESRQVPDRAGGAPAKRIYHLTTPGEWAAATAEGAYRYSTRDRILDEVGFVHCGHGEQVLEVAERLYADMAELVLMPREWNGRFRLPAGLRAGAGTDS